MQAKDRYQEIAEISGMSEAVVRRVLEAEKESVVNSLKRGERATLLGRCVMRPEISQRLGMDGKLENEIKVKISVANAITSALKGVTEFENEEVAYESGIRLKRIPDLE